ncbi:MAG: branched-chain amino acid ABC transporter permease [ANME-2 cluster archaeon]|nr:MAG: branched-chain amino acid ABC transporter permease [ANME-2 cluster archaeon]
MPINGLIKKCANISNMMYIAMLVIGLALPWFIHDNFLNRILILTFFFIMFATSWNLLAYSGQASLGHAAFLGIGGFASTMIVKQGITPVIGILIGASLAAFVGLLLGIICVRLKEWFLGLVTFGFAIIMAAVINESSVFINAINLALQSIGMAGNLDPHMFGGSLGIYSPHIVSQNQYYYLFFFTMMGTILVTHLIFRSKIGIAFAAIRENQEEARMMGINTTKYKLIAFVISTFMAGFAGAIFAPYNYFINPEIFSIHYSFMPIIMTISGGIGTIGGPILGGLVINLIWEEMGMLGMTIDRLLVLGAILVLEILFLPRGLIPLIKKLYAGVTSRGMPL